MSKIFRKQVVNFLETLYNVKGPSVDTPKMRKLLNDPKFKNVKIYLELNDFIKITKKDEESHAHLTDYGVEYLINYKNQKAQRDFNRVVALTGTILALIGIYTFTKDIGLLNENNFWIKYVFLVAVIVAIGPIIAFIINSYFGSE